MRRNLFLVLGALVFLATGIMLGRLVFTSHSTPSPESLPASGAGPGLASIAQEVPATAQPQTESDLVLDLFNPTDEENLAQRSRTELSQQVEQAITMNFTLRQCKLITQQEYGDNYRAMLIYILRSRLALTAQDAKTELDRITEASSASYALIYSRTPCDTPQLVTAASQLADWRNALIAANAQPQPR